MKSSLTICAVAVLALAVSSMAQAELTLDSATYFGGTGDERGTSLAIRGSDLYVAGSRGGGDLCQTLEALLLRYSIPSLGLAWHATLPRYSYFTGVAPSADIVYAVGGAKPPICGAQDGVGGTEEKALLAWYNASGGLLGCQSPNFFTYTGCEGYGVCPWWSEAGGSPVIVVEEGSSRAVYAVGYAQANGSNWTAVLAKYDSTGNLLWWRSVGDTGGGNYSGAHAVAWVNGYLYVAGRTSEQQAGLWKYDSAGNRMWLESFEAGGSRATDVAAAGGYLYLAGRRWNGADHDVLLLKYDEGGNLQWSNEWGGAADDVGHGIAVSGDRVYVVGETSSFGEGGKDAFLLEVDAADGTIVSTTCWGGAAHDIAADVAVTGSDIYVVGQTASFGAGGDDLMLLRYTTTIQVAIDIKPGSYPNAINLGSQGLIPVAILSDEEFDATTVDPDTVELAGAGVAVRGKSNKFLAHEEDVNGDGLVDLVVQVATANLDPDSFQDGYAILTAKTYDGQAIEGADEIIIVPPEQ